MFTVTQYRVFMLLCLASIVLVQAYDWYFNRRRLRDEAERRLAQSRRRAIANGGGDFEDHELFSQIWLDLVAQLRDVGELTNRTARAAEVRGFEIVPVTPRLCQKTIRTIHALTREQSDDQFLLTTALILFGLAKQVHALERRKDYLTVRALCSQLVGLAEQVTNGMAQGALKDDAVGAIYRAFTALSNQIALHLASGIPPTRPGRRRNP